MHKSSMKRMEWFIKNYEEFFSYSDEKIRVLDIGSYDVNGTYKTLFGEKYSYFGADIEKGPNVDIVLTDIYNWNGIEDNSFDVVISGQAFEHIEYPWETIKEMTRVLKPDGFLCIIAPSSAREHRYPLDCYRYYQDGLPALIKWSGVELLHSSISGVPYYFADEDWDESSNDAVVIGKKKGIMKLENTPQLKYERRIYDFEYRYRYRFMLKWLEYLKLSKNIVQYLYDNEYYTISIYGINEIADIVKENILEANKTAKHPIKIECSLSYKNQDVKYSIPNCNMDAFDYEVDAIIISDPDYQKRIEENIKYDMEKREKKADIINIEYIVDTIIDENK